MGNFQILAVVCLLFLNSTSGYAQQAARQQASVQQGGKRVQLKSQVALSQRTVIRLRDVADVSGFPPSVQKDLLQLDLADWSAEEESVTLSRNHVRLRLQLALPDLSEVDFTGPEQVTVKKGESQDLEQHMLTELRSELASQWNVDVAAVRVRLLQPLPDRIATTAGQSGVDAISTVLPNPTRPGTVRVTFLSYRDSRLVGTQRLMVDAQLFAEVVCSARHLERGITLGPDDIRTHWQSVRSPQTYLAEDDVLGKTLRLSLQRGQPISDRHLSEKKSSKRAVSSRDTVKVTSRSGSLVVALNNGVALQSGSIGDRIRVRNPDSKKVIVARVVSPTEVRVE